MSVGGTAGPNRVLVLESGESSFLAGALDVVAAASKVGHVVGISTRPRSAWVEAIEAAGLEDVSVTLLDRSGASGDSDGESATGQLTVRDVSDTSLGDLGVAAVEAISATDRGKPAVLIDSVAALTDDPGKRFKFLALLGRRVAKDDGIVLAYEGQPLPEHERHTFEEIFDSVGAEMPA